MEDLRHWTPFSQGGASRGDIPKVPSQRGRQHSSTPADRERSVYCCVWRSWGRPCGTAPLLKYGRDGLGGSCVVQHAAPTALHEPFQTIHRRAGRITLAQSVSEAYLQGAAMSLNPQHGTSLLRSACSISYKSLLSTVCHEYDIFTTH